MALAKAGVFGGAGGHEEPAPDFKLLDSEGIEFHLAATHGTARVLFFMTSSDWCQPCKVMTRGPLRDIQAKYGSHVTILSIEMLPDDRSDEDLNAYEAQWGATWPHARDTDGVARLFEVRFLSTVVILDPGGIERFRGGDPPTDVMRRVLDEMGIEATEGPA
ncbi:MAG: TlpA family protein disulfide reductase [Methanobacteriota archaeon]